MHGAWNALYLLHWRWRGDHVVTCNGAMLRARNAVGVLHGVRHGHLHDFECVMHRRANAVAMLSRRGNGKLHREFGVHRLPNAVALLYRRGDGNLLELAPGGDVHRRRNAGTLLHRPRRGKLFRPRELPTVPLGEWL